MDKMEGYSVAHMFMPLGRETWRIYRHDNYVGCISKRWDGKLGWDWHDKSMWSFHTHDFVTIH